MPVHLSKHELYRREAERLISMAGSSTFKDVAPELSRVAAHFMALAKRYRGQVAAGRAPRHGPGRSSNPCSTAAKGG